ncbi:TIGR03826 family flagellar region protein [Thalassobacillus pellis]|uniref:TIGR03826 family flagellar region protein n=1 Tax=Thalassobacillus pellis TaxID=748008 RepID=UPI0019608AD9|nr:flagellar operon protein (TIGR03826 family) [Thalassobacillus pellis]
MGELANCPRCGQLFVKATQTVCTACYKEEEAAFNTVYNFIRKRENRQATMDEVEKATGVDKGLIMKFVKQKRLRKSQFPNLSYACESCGNPIQDGKLCESCIGTFRKELKYADEIASLDKESREKSLQKHAYYSIQKGRKHH